MSKVTIQLRNVTSTVHGEHSAHDVALDLALSYQEEGFFFSPAYRRGMWDGKKHLYKLPTQAHPFGKFPTGLTYRVVKVFEEQFASDEVVYEDLRDRPKQEHPLMLTGFDLHDYEHETVNKAVETTRGLFRLPTGAGKSVIEAAVIARLNVPTLVMSHRWEILEHLKRVAEKAMGFEIGVIGGGVKNLQKFNVAMIQTVQSCIRRAVMSKPDAKIVDFIQKQCRCLIVDEAHHSSSDSYWLLANKAHNAYYRFGFSATPYRGTDADMLTEAGFGKLQVNMTPSHLVKQKRLSKPYIFFVDYGDDTSSRDKVTSCNTCGNKNMYQIQRPIGKVRKPSDDVENGSIDVEIYRTTYRCGNPQCQKEWTTYSDAVINCLVRNERRNEAIIRLVAERVRKNRSTLVLVNYIEHGVELESRLQAIVGEEQVQFVQGATENKKELLDQLSKKKKLCLIATTVFGEGVDVPSLDTLIYARASGSSIDVIQGVGRALRRAPKKWKAVVIDFQDKSDYLKSRSKFRYDLLKSESEFVVKKIKLPTKYNLVSA